MKQQDADAWAEPSVEYPESDGQPMAESDEHADELRADPDPEAEADPDPDPDPEADPEPRPIPIPFGVSCASPR